MMMRDAAGPGIEPQALVEAALLWRASDFREDVAAPQRQAAPAEAARRFQDDAIVAGAVELVGGAQAGDAGAEDRHRLARAGVARRLKLRGLRGRRA